MVRKLSPAETAAFLSAHPVDPSQVPSYGLRIVDNSTDYLIGVSPAGEIGVWDVTARDENGSRIDPSIEDQSIISRVISAFSSGLSESWMLDIQPLVNLAALGIGVYFAWQIYRSLKTRTA